MTSEHWEILEALKTLLVVYWNWSKFRELISNQLFFLVIVALFLYYESGGFFN